MVTKCVVGDKEFKGKTKVWIKEWKGGETIYREDQDWKRSL